MRLLKAAATSVISQVHANEAAVLVPLLGVTHSTVTCPIRNNKNNFKYTLTGPKFTGGSKEPKCHLLAQPRDH